MKIKLNLENLCWIIPSIVISIIVLWIINGILGFILSGIAALLLFCAFKLLNSRDSSLIVLSVDQKSAKSLKSLLYVFAFLSLLSVFLVNPLNTSYADWSSISLLNYLRAISAFLITSFFGGYFVLDLLGFNEKISRIEKVLYSFILSVLITVTSTYYFSVYIKEFSIIPLISISSCLLLLAIIRFLWKQSRSCGTDNTIKSKISLSSIILLLVILFAFFGLLSIFSENSTLISGDMWRQNGWGVMITRGVFPKALEIFDNYLAANLALSGIPILNMHTLLVFPFAALLILSFYLMVNSLFNSAKKSALSTIFFTIGGGFGGSLFLYSYLTGPSNSQALLENISAQTILDTRYTYGSPFWFAESIFSFISVFVLLHFLNTEKSKNRLYLLIIPAAIFIGYITRPEIAIFFLALIIFSLLYRERGSREHIKRISIASLLGLVLTLAYFNPSNNGFIAILLLLTCSSIAIITLIIVSLNYKVKIQASIKRRLPIFLGLIYFIGLSFLVWFDMRPDIQNNFDKIYAIGVVPWYAYFLLLGLPAIIAMIGVIFYFGTLREDLKKPLKLFLVLSLLFILIGRFLSFINTQTTFSLPFWEIRTAFWARIFIAVCAACLLIPIFNSTKTRYYKHARFSSSSKKLVKILVIGCIISVVVVVGVSSTILRTEYWTNFAQYGTAGEGQTTVSPSELEAIDFLRLNTKPYSQTITLTALSWDKVKYFGGIPNTFDRTSLFFDATQSAFLLRTLSTQDFIYVDQGDQFYLDQPYKNSYLVTNYLPYLPVPFNYSNVAIYEIPEISPPNSNASLAIVTPGTGFTFADDRLSTWDLHAQSRTIKNITTTSSSSIFTLSGYLTTSSRDYYLLSQPVINMNTNDFPTLSIKWKSTDSCATFNVKYSDGTYLTEYTGSKLISQSMPDWTVTTTNQPTNKTVTEIIVGIDDRTDIQVDGLQSVSIDYIAFRSNDRPQVSALTKLLAASNVDYAIVSDQDPNLCQYPQLLLASDINTYDLSDDFSSTSSQYASQTGVWLIENGELEQTQKTSYVDATITAGNQLWTDYTATVQAKSIGKLSDDIALQFRYQDSNNSYDFRMQSDLLRLGKFVNGSYSPIVSSTSYTVEGNTWYKLSVTVKGNNIVCYLNDQQVFNVVDNSFSKGQIALRTEGITAAFDNLTVQTSRPSGAT